MVENSLLEQENLVANYDMLKQIAENNSGNFVTFTQFNTSVFDVSSTEKIHTQERELSAIHLKLLAIILLICLFFEWFIRKRLTGKP